MLVVPTTQWRLSMATGNFHNVKSSKVYACDLNNDFAYDNLLLNLENSVERLDHDYSCNGHDPYELHSFPSRVVAGLGFSKDYQGFSIELELSVIVRSGYYSGCNLDWNLVCLCEGEEFELDELTDFIARNDP